MSVQVRLAVNKIGVCKILHVFSIIVVKSFAFDIPSLLCVRFARRAQRNYGARRCTAIFCTRCLLDVPEAHTNLTALQIEDVALSTHQLY